MNYRKKLTTIIGLALAMVCVSLSLSSQTHQKSHKGEETPLKSGGQEIVVSATLTPSRFSLANTSGPAWTVTITIQNPTDRELELGESLVLLEKVRGSSRYLALYISRERESPTAHLNQMSSRYGLTWGYNVQANGQYVMTLVGGGQFSFTASSTDPYEGLGYGRVSPGAERKLEVQVPAPYSLKEGHEYFALILPSVRPLNAPMEQMTRTMLRFDIGEAKSGDTYKSAEALTVKMQPADLRALVGSAAQEPWRRVFALNWLTEAHPKDALVVLLDTLRQKDAPSPMRAAAAVNLGLLKAAAAVQPLSEVVRLADDAVVRQQAVEALGVIGDSAAAPAIRPLLDDANEELAKAALKAVGQLKDADSVVPLLTLMTRKPEQKRDSASIFRPFVAPSNSRASAIADALAAIGNKAAVDGLLGLLREPRSGMQILAAEKLGLTGSRDAVAPLVNLVADRKAGKELRLQGLSSLGKLGGAEAAAALSAITDEASEELYLGALKALGEMGGTEADQAAVAALKSRHSEVRRLAANQLQTRKRTEAVASLWQAYQSETQEGVSAAMADALIQLKFSEKEAVKFLLGRLDPKVKSKKQPAWFDDVRLLRHLTGQSFGPKNKWISEKEREEELLKWRQWGLSAN